MGAKFPNQESNLGPLHWELGDLATGPLGKSQELILRSTWNSAKHTVSSVNVSYGDNNRQRPLLEGPGLPILALTAQEVIVYFP